MFEKASRMKLRFNTPVGALPVEDIWDLPLRQTTNRNKGANLNDIAKVLHRELKNDNELDFVDDVEKPNEELVLKFEIVKHIIAVRKKEIKAREDAQAAHQKKARIMEIIADKEDETLKGKSLEDLRSILQSL
jgi:hypothetical protein